MSDNSVILKHHKVSVSDVISWIFGIGVFQVGIVNTFWGKPVGFGIFLMLLSFVYFPPANKIFQQITGFRIPGFLKIMIGLFIFWAAVGVGDLFDKLDVMVKSLS